MRPSAEEIVDRFVHDARRPAFDEERLVLLRDAVTQMATLAPEAIAPHAVRILDALGNAFRVTGGDAAIDRMNDVLARLDASALEAALAERAASFDEVPPTTRPRTRTRSRRASGPRSLLGPTSSSARSRSSCSRPSSM